ncbi:hypothetical protein [Streptomyces sp. NPDC048157]|uniref:hypothetical protein n=1 Tax=Streptomyces sp. NPDC048157 TaxID=3365503 RepID=UPI003718E21C
MSVLSAIMMSMDLTAILTGVAALVGAFVGTFIGYWIRDRRRAAKVHVPSFPSWAAPMPVAEWSKIPDGAITSGKIEDILNER